MNENRKFSQGLLDDEKIIANLNIKAGQIILDAGCGNGYMAKKFSKVVVNSGKVYSLDSDKQFIKKLREEVGKHFYMQIFQKN